MSSLEILKQACDQYGQRKAAKRIKRSVTAVNQTLHGTYPKPENILKLCAATFTEFTTNEIVCPTLGTIHRGTCSRYSLWAEQNKVHHDRLYRTVKESCLTCKQGRKDDRT
jgi:hypothetical protein